MMLTRWNWCRRYQWKTVTGIVAILVIYLYSTSVNMWLSRLRIYLPEKSSTLHTSPLPETTPSDEDDPLTRLDLRLGRWDSSRTFKTFDYAAVGDLYPKISATRRVCLATQSSIDSLQEILKIAAHWTGPISIAVLVNGEEMKLLQEFLMWLLKCQPETYSRLAVHVTMPSYRMAVLGTIPWAQNCSTPLLTMGASNITAGNWYEKYPYPQNLLRNSARKNCQTPYVYMVDVDIVPSKGMAEKLDKFLSPRLLCKLCAYVIPTYELDWTAKFPANKSELLQLVKAKLALPFHQKVFRLNQLSSDIPKWEASRDIRSRVYVSHNVINFKDAYEPFYVAPDDVPPHDERFLGYGNTRSSQVYEMFLLGYQFKVLSPIFSIHWGLQSISTRPRWRMVQSSRNSKKFKTFRKELFVRYGKDPLHYFTNQLELQNVLNSRTEK